MITQQTLKQKTYELLVTNPKLFIDPKAHDQLKRVASLSGCKAAVGLPDLHPGNGIPLGAAFGFESEIYPDFIGSDAGCGVSLTITDITQVSASKLEKKISKLFDTPCSFQTNLPTLGALTWQKGIKGLSKVEGLPKSLHQTVEKIAPQTETLSAAPFPSSGELTSHSLGTIGGGNHFVEVTRISKVFTPESAEPAGLKKGRLGVLAHSGSRGFGYALGERWQGRCLKGQDAKGFMAELTGTINVAAANRFLLSYQALSALGAAKSHRIAGWLDVVHNQIKSINWGKSRLWAHYKGAAAAPPKELTIVLGSRGAPSWILEGDRSEISLFSVAHGAGRRMSRADALARFREKYTKASLSRTKIGNRVVCDNRALLFEEHPEAYKPIEQIIDALISRGIAKPVALLEPIVTVKK